MTTAVELSDTGQKQAPDAADEMSLWTVGRVVLAHAGKIAAMSLIGALAGIGIGLATPKVFRASATFLPQAAESGASSSGLAALAASQLGVRLTPGGQTWGTDMYIKLLGSRTVLEPIARDSVQVPEMAGKFVPVLDLVNAQGSTEALRVEDGVRALSRMISIAEDKKVGTVSVSVTTPWPSVSATLVNRLLRRLNEFNLETRRSQAKAELEFVEQQTALADTALRESEDRLKAFLESNRVVGTPELQFERDRLMRVMNQRQQLYSAMLDSREQARIREVRDTPVITVLEPPRIPLVREARGTARKAGIGLLAGGAIALLVAFLAEAVDTDKRENAADFRKFLEALDRKLPRFLRRRA